MAWVFIDYEDLPKGASIDNRYWSKRRPWGSSLVNCAKWDSAKEALTAIGEQYNKSGDEILRWMQEFNVELEFR